MSVGVVAASDHLLKGRGTPEQVHRYMSLAAPAKPGEPVISGRLLAASRFPFLNHYLSVRPTGSADTSERRNVRGALFGFGVAQNSG